MRRILNHHRAPDLMLSAFFAGIFAILIHG